ncbi:hypothetical protein ES703_64874 [subsurface metagenome]
MSSNCKNNIITRNNIKNNQYLGIYIYDLTCQDNIIYQNLLIGTGDWHARDEGTNNQWYTSGIGNYWDNHTSPDSDNDGIVDIPYTWIAGNADSEDSFPLAASPLHVGDRIHIDDDGISAPTWSRTVELNFWCTGSGTYSDPYIIDGVEIDAGGTGNGIYIENSKNIHFVIRNCTVYNSSNGSYDAGIKLENTNNGILSKNNCTNNGGHGILLRNYCENNTISGNTANENYYGIFLSSHCDNNTILGNTASNIMTSNQFNGILLFFDSNNNTISGNTVIDNLVDGILLLSDCDDNIILENTAIDNKGNGIELNSDCDNNLISGNTANNEATLDQSRGISITSNCKSNTISGNLIRNNLFYGIGIVSLDCQNNLIYQNSLIGTSNWHARDDGTNNHWNSSGIGNYWDNHTSPDSDKDGIVDNSYSWITGSAGNEDSFPLAESPIHIGEKIYIDDSGVSAYTWFITAKLNLWCIGSGTNFDPYVIDGLEIDAGGSGSSILIGNSSVYFIIRNCKIFNSGSGSYDAGIKLENTNNGILSNNNCSNNGRNGIFLYNNCANNTISGNIINDNSYGINFYLYCDNNTISGNNANDNSYGIYLNIYCNNNTISGNNANGNGGTGIFIYYECNRNTISGNTANNNGNYGIVLNSACDNNTISGNTANGHPYYGISLWTGCNDNAISRNIFNGNDYYGINLDSGNNYNTISGNIINDNIQYGIRINDNCDENNITENYMYFNIDGAIYIETADCDDNIVERDVLVSNDWKFIYDSGTNTTVTLNYFSNILPSFVVEVVAQSFSTTEFTVTLKISREMTESEVSNLTIQIWWDGTTMPSNSITELGNGLYNVSLTPIFVNSGEDPILLNMTISAAHHMDKYFETYIAIEPPEIAAKLLQVELTEHSYSLEHFNLTIFVCNETELGIDSAIIQMWWNGVDVSNDVINLGNGFYFVSLEPITVAPGEDPILLNGIISADGYQDKSFETYIAVDPDILDKEIGEIAEEFPLTIIIIAIASIAGGIGVAGITIFLLRKRKRASEVK